MSNKYFTSRDTQLAHMRQQGYQVVTFKRCAMVAAFMEQNGKWSAKVWLGKADKPTFYRLYRTRAAMEADIASSEQGQIKSEEYRKTRNAARTAGKCTTPADVWAKAAKDNYISAPDVAVCLRAVLAREFPGVKFSVRSDNSLRVSWTDGPNVADVNRIAQNYSGEGFDGMIDMRYSIKRWLSRDGSMSLAHDTGTTGSAGCEPEMIGSAHAPDAVLVSPGCDFVFTTRHLSPSLKRSLMLHVCQQRGVVVPELATETDVERFINTTRVGSDYLGCLIYRESQKEAA